MKPVESETGGRARVIPDGDKTMSLKVQQVFTAIGAEPGEGWYLPQKTRVFSFPRPTLETMGKMMELSHCTILRQYMPIVFGGDLTNPTKSVADAIASGKQAAIALDTFFHEDWNAIESRLEECRVGTGNSLEIYLGRDRKNRSRQIVSDEKINADYFPHADQVIPCSLSPEESITSFSEVGKAFSTAQATEEAGRCFNCGICNECNNCRLFCPEMSVILGNTRDINTDYCKGCGICAAECPRGVMTLEEEKL
jgi:Pyruvate/2-oxoacid:ferredoxin oxidoreductase delta subunit